jgi:hypothetical protein
VTQPQKASTISKEERDAYRADVKKIADEIFKLTEKTWNSSETLKNYDEENTARLKEVLTLGVIADVAAAIGKAFEGNDGS